MLMNMALPVRPDVPLEDIVPRFPRDFALAKKFIRTKAQALEVLAPRRTSGGKRPHGGGRGPLQSPPPVSLERRPDGKFDLVDGNHRFVAAMRLGLHAIPADIRDPQPTRPVSWLEWSTRQEKRREDLQQFYARHAER
jgi:hypothetical protein